jgi:hypothetical protein
MALSALYLHRLFAFLWHIFIILRCSYSCLCLFLPILFPIRWKMREECYLGPPDPRHFRLFSVSIYDSIIISSFSKDVSLSSIRIPIRLCHPEVQKAHKIHRSQSRPPKRSRILTIFGLLMTSLNTQQVYSLPGTKHVLAHEKSLDSTRQQSLVNTAINNAVTANEQFQPIEAPAIPDPEPTLPNIPQCFLCDTDSIPHLADTGANRIILNNPQLVKNFKIAEGGVKGINGAPASIAGVGDYDFPLRSDDGIKHNINVPVVCVPSSPFSLFPPQLLHKALQDKGFDVKHFKHDDKEYVFEYRPPNETTWRKMTIPVDHRGMFTHWSNPGYHRFLALASKYDPSWSSYPGHTLVSDDDDDQTDASPPSLITESTGQTRETPSPSSIEGSIPSLPIDVDFPNLPGDLPAEDPSVQSTRNKQRRLSVFHERYGHLSFPKLHLMARAGLIPKDLAGVEPPTCPGCAYGKAHRKPWRTKGTRNLRHIKPATHPGQVVSVDQLVSPTPGFVPTHRGKPTTTRYIGATVFVDHFTDFTYIHLMSKMDAESTVIAKQAFERTCSKYGVTVRHYHADNGLFDTHKFKLSIQQANQSLTFCGVNAHHQNGKAERRIKDVTQGARTALLHAVHRWPKAVDASLWPAALKNYVNLRNSLPIDFTPEQKTGKRITPAKFEGSPISKMSGVEVEPNLRDFHPFGSPVYVLEDSLQALQSHNKWHDRTRVGIFLCHSPEHASSVPLVLNTRTGMVSPQFHCIYDDAFDTCRNDAKFDSLWQRKAKLDTIPRPDLTLVSPTDPMQRSISAPLDSLPPIPQFVHRWDQTSLSDDTTLTEAASVQPSVVPTDVSTVDEGFTFVPPVPGDETTPVVTRTGRRVIPNRFIYNDDMIHANTAYLDTFSTLSTDGHIQELLQPPSGEEPHPFALAVDHLFANSASSDPDVLTFEEAMRCPDRDKFIEAMRKELDDHISRHHWKVVPRKTIPGHKRAIPMVWSMKCKRDPAGKIIKWKARLCAGGHRSIENVDYWGTYSPVVSWSTVRLAIIFALINNWHIKSIDFVLAYPQAPVKTDIYMLPPRVPPDFIIVTVALP